MDFLPPGGIDFLRSVHRHRGCVEAQGVRRMHLKLETENVIEQLLANQRSWRRCLAMICLLPLLVVSAAPAVAQLKYTPEHRDVVEIVRKSRQFLEGRTLSEQIGPHVLAAIAIVQAEKRYTQTVPADHPLVKSACESVVQRIEMNEGALAILKMTEVYIPAISTILLTEVDKLKYRDQITKLVQELERRIQPHGGMNYTNQEKDVGDTSQLQYASLALYVASVNGFTVNPDTTKRMLEWLIASQQANGYYHYRLKQQSSGGGWLPFNDSPESTPSIQAGGLGTVYLLADLMKLFPRKKAMAQLAMDDQFIDLPKTVTIYVPPIDGGGDQFNTEGPVVRFDTGKLNSCVSAGNRAIETNFSVDTKIWNFYYLYALERYAWFREQAEGGLSRGSVSSWYDDGVEFLKESQQDTGAFYRPDFNAESNVVCTAFAILFLVRSSEIISMPNADSELEGREGIPSGVLQVKGARIIGGSAEKDISAMLSMLKEDPTEEEMEALAQSMKKAIESFAQLEEAGRSQTKTFLRSLVMSDNYYRRKIAVKFLAAEQNMDNVPALIFALGDGEFDICLEAHDGLRLISRRIDSMTLTDETRRKSEDPFLVRDEDVPRMEAEYRSLKKRWTEWYLELRPNAEIWD